MNIPSLAALSTASLLNDIHSATYDVIEDIKNILNPNEIGCLVMLLDGSAQDIVDYEEFIPKFADNVYDHNVVLLYDLLSENCFVEKIVLTAISLLSSYAQIRLIKKRLRHYSHLARNIQLYRCLI